MTYRSLRAARLAGAFDGEQTRHEPLSQLTFCTRRRSGALAHRDPDSHRGNLFGVEAFSRTRGARVLAGFGFLLAILSLVSYALQLTVIESC